LNAKSEAYFLKSTFDSKRWPFMRVHLAMVLTKCLLIRNVPNFLICSSFYSKNVLGKHVGGMNVCCQMRFWRFSSKYVFLWKILMWTFWPNLLSQMSMNAA